MNLTKYYHYTPNEKRRLIDLTTLRQGVMWAIKHRTDIQVLYPQYTLGDNYVELLEQYPHVRITSEDNGGDIIVLNGWDSALNQSDLINRPAVLHCEYRDFINHYLQLGENIHRFTRLNIVFTDISRFSDSDAQEYEKALTSISDVILDLYRQGNQVQLNLVTDRIMLTEMNNCNAGVESVTLAPNGKFYPCPAFYMKNEDAIGSPNVEIEIPNSRLYKLENAPICRICDAYHCKRCVMLNKSMTLETNTPSHQQCLMAHIERKVSKQLIEQIREYGEFAPEVKMSDLDYNDPFDKILRQHG